MFLGIDIGTSSVKVVLIDPAQKVLAAAGEALGVQRPHPGFSEQDPAAWWRATEAALDAIAAKAPDAMARVRGIGLSGQMHGAALLDAAHEVLRPAMLWNDTRAASEAAALQADHPEICDIIGNPVMPGFTAPKLLWVRAHEPDIFERTALVLLPKDYVRLCLTGEAITDVSDASGTAWLDVGKRAWSDRALELTGMSRAQMPNVVEGTEPAGVLRGELARRWGIHGRVVVAGGGGDNATSACGIGAVTAGSAFLSLGTSGVLFASTARFAPNVDAAAHAFGHAVPKTWHQMGVILSASDSLEWLSRLLETPVPDLVGSLGARIERPSPVLFAPYLSGERTPHNSANLRGGFAGLGHEADRLAMTQAVLEGVAFAFVDCRDALSAAGTRIDRAWAVGGGARSTLWLKILASALDMPIDLPEAAEIGGAFGAARLAICAATGAAWQEVMTPPRRAATIEPEAALRDAYAESIARWRTLAPALAAIDLPTSPGG